MPDSPFNYPYVNESEDEDNEDEFRSPDGVVLFGPMGMPPFGTQYAPPFPPYGLPYGPSYGSPFMPPYALPMMPLLPFINPEYEEHESEDYYRGDYEDEAAEEDFRSPDGMPPHGPGPQHGPGPGPQHGPMQGPQHGPGGPGMPPHGPGQGPGFQPQPFHPGGPGPGMPPPPFYPGGPGGPGYGPGGPGGAFPPGPPPAMEPSFAPAYGITPKAVDPGAIRRCLYRYVFIRLYNGRRFWVWLTFVGRTSVSGYRWNGRRWVFWGTDLRNIDEFICF